MRRWESLLVGWFVSWLTNKQTNKQTNSQIAVFFTLGSVFYHQNSRKQA
jgi:hypothetical protein